MEFRRIFVDIWFYGSMVSRMKTTLNIEDELFIAAKKRAVDERRTLRSLVEESLRKHLERNEHVAVPGVVRWIATEGALPEDLDVSDREAMHEWVRKGS